MVGVWNMCLWEQMGHPEKVNLVELGPGRGTLMADLLRVSINTTTVTAIGTCFELWWSLSPNPNVDLGCYLSYKC